MVFVDYPLRFSDVTTLAARRVRHGVAPYLICQPGLRHALALPTTLSLPFPLHSSPSCAAPPSRASGRASLHLLPAAPLTELDQLGLIRSSPQRHCLLDRLTRVLTLAQ